MAMQIIEATVAIGQGIIISKGSCLQRNKANRIITATPHVFPRGSARAAELVGGACLVHTAKYLHYIGDARGSDFIKTVSVSPSVVCRIDGTADVTKLDRGGWGVKGSMFDQKIEN